MKKLKNESESTSDTLQFLHGDGFHRSSLDDDLVVRSDELAEFLFQISICKPAGDGDIN